MTKTLYLIASLVAGLVASSNAQCNGNKQCEGWNEMLESLNQGDNWTVCKNVNDKIEDPCSPDACVNKKGFTICDSGDLVAIEFPAENGLSVVNTTQFLEALSTLVANTALDSITFHGQESLNLHVCPAECSTDLACSFDTGCIGDCYQDESCLPEGVTKSPTSSPTEAPTSSPTVPPTDPPTLATSPPTPEATEELTSAPVKSPTSSPKTDSPTALQTEPPTSVTAPVTSPTMSPTQRSDANVDDEEEDPTEKPTSSGVAVTVNALLVTVMALGAR